MLRSNKIFLEEFSEETRLKHILCMVLFIFSAFKLIKSQEKEEFFTQAGVAEQQMAGVFCLSRSSSTLAILNEWNTILNFRKWFLEFEKTATGCLLIFLHHYHYSGSKHAITP